MMPRIESSTYETCLSLDLRPFDQAKGDMGVGDFIDRLGFVPTRALFHNSCVDLVHTFNGRVDNTMLTPLQVAQRGIPGGQFWMR
jgi:hypothetical protein